MLMEPEYCFVNGPKEYKDDHEWLIWGRMMAWANSAIVQVIEHDLERGWCKCRVVGIDARILGYIFQKEIWMPYSWLVPASCQVIESKEFYCVHGYYGTAAKVYAVSNR